MARYYPLPSTDLFDSGREKHAIYSRLLYLSGLCRISLPLLLSMLGNIILVGYILTLPTPISDPTKPAPSGFESRSQFAGLKRDIPKQWHLNEFTTEAEWADIWDNQSSYDAGVIALDDNYARAQGLPRSQRWPWDQTKGIYLLNAYHNLHCIKNLRSSLEEFQTGVEQSIPWPHVQHCLLVLRDDIMCNADDTPRYSGYQPNHHSAYGQWRMCRDWKALEAWAQDKERSGCWKHIPGEQGVDGFERLDRYRFCPEGSNYKEMSETMWMTA